MHLQPCPYLLTFCARLLPDSGLARALARWARAGPSLAGVWAGLALHGWRWLVVGGRWRALAGCSDPPAVIQCSL